MSTDYITLPNTPLINITLGLKHCNQNRALYHKILNRFVIRYQNINLQETKEEERGRTLHSLKGLAATLGMVSLAQILSKLELSFTETLIHKFTQELNEIVKNIIKLP